MKIDTSSLPILENKGSTKEIASVIRKNLKKNFPNCKFSIIKDSHNHISVYLVEANFQAFTDTKETEIQISRYSLEKKYQEITSKAKEVMAYVIELTDFYNWDRSDAMTDYFDVNFYTTFGIGKWDKAFKVVEKKAATAKKTDKKTSEIEIIDYSEKSILITGDTKRIKDDLRRLGGRWNFSKKGWFFRKTDREKVESLLKEVGSSKAIIQKTNLSDLATLREKEKETLGDFAPLRENKQEIKETIPETSVDEKELQTGIKIELEHTTDKELAKKIALHHLEEFPDYYTRLVKMEKEAEQEKNSTQTTVINKENDIDQESKNSDLATLREMETDNITIKELSKYLNDTELAQQVYHSFLNSKRDEWFKHLIKQRLIKSAIYEVIKDSSIPTEFVLLETENLLDIILKHEAPGYDNLEPNRKEFKQHDAKEIDKKEPLSDFAPLREKEKETLSDFAPLRENKPKHERIKVGEKYQLIDEYFGISKGSIGIALKWRFADGEKAIMLDFGKNKGGQKITGLIPISYLQKVTNKKEPETIEKTSDTLIVDEQINQQTKHQSTINQPTEKPDITANFLNDFVKNQAIEKLIDYNLAKNAEFTPEEKVFINTYSGYGGLQKYGAKGESIMTEYFTPDPTVKKMWELAYKFGYNGGKVIENSVGVGRFLKYVPEGAKVDAFEINRYSYLICKILYPTINIRNIRFEQLFINENNESIKAKVEPTAELIIGNPPYGNFNSPYSHTEKKYTKATNLIEYFISRSLDLLKPGGLLIYIIGVSVENGGIPFLDQGKTLAKTKIAEKANLIDAYRLGNKIFTHTDVLADIVVFRKINN